MERGLLPYFNRRILKTVKKKYIVIWEEFAEINNGSGTIYNCEECDSLAELAYAYYNCMEDKHRYNVKVCEILEEEKDLK